MIFFCFTPHINFSIIGKHQMKKLFLGSGRLQNNFKMIRIKYNSRNEVEQIKEGVMELMSGYLQKYGGYAFKFNIENLSM